MNLDRVTSDCDASDDVNVLIEIPVHAPRIDRLSLLYRGVLAARDLPEITLAPISHYFEKNKDLERGKWVKSVGWVGPEEVKNAILAGIAFYRKAKKKPVC